LRVPHTRRSASPLFPYTTLFRSEQLLLIAAFAEYGAQIAGGIPMSQLEIIRPEALGVSKADIRAYEDAVADVIEAGGAQSVKAKDRKSTRLNSSHVKISYAVFCL